MGVVGQGGAGGKGPRNSLKRIAGLFKNANKVASLATEVVTDADAAPAVGMANKSRAIPDTTVFVSLLIVTVVHCSFNIRRDSGTLLRSGLLT